MNEARFTPFLTLALGALLASGCSSTERTERNREPPQPVLSGQATYLNGSVAVDAKLGPFRWNELFAANAPAGGDSQDDTGRRKHRRSSDDGFGGGGRRGDGSYGGGRGEGGYGRGERVEGGDEASTEDGGVNPVRMRTGGALRKTLTVVFHNTGSKQVQLRISEVSSLLGNFVPEPETLTIEPGASQSLEAMHSSYPEDIGGLELRVAIRTSAGEEEHTIQLAPEVSGDRAN